MVEPAHSADPTDSETPGHADAANQKAIRPRSRTGPMSVQLRVPGGRNRSTDTGIFWPRSGWPRPRDPGRRRLPRRGRCSRVAAGRRGDGAARLRLRRRVTGPRAGIPRRVDVPDRVLRGRVDGARGLGRALLVEIVLAEMRHPGEVDTAPQLGPGMHPVVAELADNTPVQRAAHRNGVGVSGLAHPAHARSEERPRVPMPRPRREHGEARQPVLILQELLAMGGERRSQAGGPRLERGVHHVRCVRRQPDRRSNKQSADREDDPARSTRTRHTGQQTTSETSGHSSGAALQAPQASPQGAPGRSRGVEAGRGLPVEFAPEYRPRDRFLTPEELAKLVGALLLDHAARVAFIVATSASWGESCRAMRGRDFGHRRAGYGSPRRPAVASGLDDEAPHKLTGAAIEIRMPRRSLCYPESSPATAFNGISGAVFLRR